MTDAELKPMTRIVARWTLVALAGLVAVLVVIVGCYAGFKTVGRWQHLADARNNVKISRIEIRNQEQRIQVAKQQAEIRLQDAIGVREAQDEIAKTLTPLYVQFEMVDALRRIAESGRNNTVVYVPSGANGIPLVSTVNPNQVGTPDDGKQRAVHIEVRREGFGLWRWYVVAANGVDVAAASTLARRGRAVEQAIRVAVDTLDVRVEP